MRISIHAAACVLLLGAPASAQPNEEAFLGVWDCTTPDGRTPLFAMAYAVDGSAILVRAEAGEQNRTPYEIAYEVHFEWSLDGATLRHAPQALAVTHYIVDGEAKPTEELEKLEAQMRERNAGRPLIFEVTQIDADRFAAERPPLLCVRRSDRGGD